MLVLINFIWQEIIRMKFDVEISLYTFEYIWKSFLSILRQIDAHDVSMQM